MGVAAQWLPRCCPRCCPAAVAMVECYDTSIPMLVEALRRHGCCLAVAGTMEAAGRERGRCAGLAGEGFLKQQCPTQRKGAKRHGAQRASRSCFLGTNVLLPLAKVLPLCRGARGTRVAANRLSAFLFARVATLQGLPLLRASSTECCRLPLVELFLSKRRRRARIDHGTKIG